MSMNDTSFVSLLVCMVDDEYQYDVAQITQPKFFIKQCSDEIACGCPGRPTMTHVNSATASLIVILLTCE